jgi:hypothetical protein
MKPLNFFGIALALLIPLTAVAQSEGDDDGADAQGEETSPVKVKNTKMARYCDKKAVKTAVDDGLADFEACYDTLTDSKPKASGEAKIHWKIFLNGDIKTPKVKRSSLGSDDFKSCLTDVVKEWEFEMTGGGLCMVDITLTFGK